MSSQPDGPMQRKVYQTSCERCRKRKVKCERTKPCSKCHKANVNCVFTGSGEKQRPAPRGYVQALEGQITSLENFITKLVEVDASAREEMLAKFSNKSSSAFRAKPAILDHESEATGPKAEAIKSPTHSRLGHLRKLDDGESSEYHGATSFFEISAPDDHESLSPTSKTRKPSLDLGRNRLYRAQVGDSDTDVDSLFSPKSEICRILLAEFFQKQYPYFMYFYREGFIMDYDSGEGKYYSDLLLYAICSMGALVSDDLRELSDIFFNRAQELLYAYYLETPNLTTLQALLLMGHREIALGKTSKGWLLSGMAFRLATSMGLHLDPSNWTDSDDSRTRREILRRTYWAAFAVDKHLSLYFGRPPALHLRESDVISTVRIPYPPEWQPLLNKYVVKDALATDFEDGDGLVAFFIQQAELSKIIYRIIIEVFENRSSKANETVLATSIHDIQVSLRKWESELPAKVHWNEWSVGQIPALVLYLHMQYHTAMIVLHRPPRQLLRDPEIGSSEGVEICYHSLEKIVKLLRLFSKNYRYNCLPVTFVHILASASSVILMKQRMMNISWEDLAISKPLELVLEAANDIGQTWPCAVGVRKVIEAARAVAVDNTTFPQSPLGLDTIGSLASGVTYDPISFDMDFELENIEEFLNPDGYFDDLLNWTGASFAQDAKRTET